MFKHREFRNSLYNIAPSQPVGIIRQDPSRPARQFSLARWGLIPSWAKADKINGS